MTITWQESARNLGALVEALDSATPAGSEYDPATARMAVSTQKATEAFSRLVKEAKTQGNTPFGKLATQDPNTGEELEAAYEELVTLDGNGEVNGGALFEANAYVTRTAQPSGPLDIAWGIVKSRPTIAVAAGIFTHYVLPTAAAAVKVAAISYFCQWTGGWVCQSGLPN